MKTCQFCQKDTVYVPLQVSAKHTFHVYWCNECSAEYLSSDGHDAAHLYVMINNRMYRWTYHTDKRGTVGLLWFIGEPGEQGVRPNRKLKLLKSFKGALPQITPQNVERKLRFILVFL